MQAVTKIYTNWAQNEAALLVKTSNTMCNCIKYSRIRNKR